MSGGEQRETDLRLRFQKRSRSKPMAVFRFVCGVGDVFGVPDVEEN